MSGGSYDYAYQRIADLADEIRTDEATTRNARLAFKRHLKLVAEAAQAIEWVDSCDSAKGDELEKIRACISSGAELAEAIETANVALQGLKTAIEWATGENAK